MKKNLQIREGKEKTVIFFMADAYSIRACKESGGKKEEKAMTYLELIARVGTSPMDVVKMYFKGMITEKELSNVIGRNRAGSWRNIKIRRKHLFWKRHAQGTRKINRKALAKI